MAKLLRYDLGMHSGAQKLGRVSVPQGAKASNGHDEETPPSRGLYG